MRTASPAMRQQVMAAARPATAMPTRPTEGVADQLVAPDPAGVSA